MESRFEVRDSVYKQAGPIVIAVAAGVDAVVSATRTWSFTAATFDATQEGHEIAIAGAANGANNGVFTILTVVDATHIITVERGLLVNETFGAGVTAQVSMDPCFAIQSGITQIQFTFGDGTILQANGASALALLENNKSIIRQAETRGMTTGGPFKWTFSVVGTACFPVDENSY